MAPAIRGTWDLISRVEGVDLEGTRKMRFDCNELDGQDSRDALDGYEGGWRVLANEHSYADERAMELLSV